MLRLVVRSVPRPLLLQRPPNVYLRAFNTTSNLRTMTSKGGEFTAENIPKQQQSLPGTEKDMQPTSESTKLEAPGGLREYTGVGKLRNKKAIITGGDSGIGRAVAVLYAREGCDVTIVYLPEEEVDAKETARMVKEEGKECLTLALDLEDFDNCKKAVDQHVQKFGKIDILVNNASKQVMCKDFKDIDLSMVESTFKCNILQMFAVTKYALPHMGKGSSIINTTSTVGFRGSAAMVDYSSTKGAITTFTRSLAQQLLPKGIRVNAVAPGPVHTPLQPASRPAEGMEEFGKGSGLGRPGQPSEIAPSFVFLASAEAALYAGQILHAYPIGD